MVRCFLAISLSESVKKRLQALQQELAKTGADVRWVRPEGIHLTLKFLGNVPEEKIEPITKAAQEVVAKFGPLRLRVKGLGAFPSGRKPRVIWAGLEGDLKPLLRLQKELEDSLTKLGFEPESRPFVPHLTLGRVKSGRKMDKLRQVLAEKNDRVGEGWEEMRIENLVLYQSTLKPSGAVYTPLKIIPFGGANPK